MTLTVELPEDRLAVVLTPPGVQLRQCLDGGDDGDAVAAGSDGPLVQRDGAGDRGLVQGEGQRRLSRPPGLAARSAWRCSNRCAANAAKYGATGTVRLVGADQVHGAGAVLGGTRGVEPVPGGAGGAGHGRVVHPPQRPRRRRRRAAQLRRSFVGDQGDEPASQPGAANSPARTTAGRGTGRVADPGADLAHGAAGERGGVQHQVQQSALLASQ